MSARPSDSVFDVPERPSTSLPDAPISDIAGHRHEDATVQPQTETQWANAELVSIASTIQELQGRLEEANSRLEAASCVETKEVEIGRLFVEAQRFSEESLSKLETQIHEILCEAEAKATEILTEATVEAREIRQRAQEAAFASTATARELQAAITGFTKVNDELVKELGALHTMLTPATEQPIAEIEPLPGNSEDG